MQLQTIILKLDIQVPPFQLKIEQYFSFGPQFWLSYLPVQCTFPVKLELILLEIVIKAKEHNNKKN